MSRRQGEHVGAAHFKTSRIRGELPLAGAVAGREKKRLCDPGPGWLGAVCLWKVSAAVSGKDAPGLWGYPGAGTEDLPGAGRPLYVCVRGGAGAGDAAGPAGRNGSFVLLRPAAGEGGGWAETGKYCGGGEKPGRRGQCHGVPGREAGRHQLWAAAGKKRSGCILWQAGIGKGPAEQGQGHFAGTAGTVFYHAHGAQSGSDGSLPGAGADTGRTGHRIWAGVPGTETGKKADGFFWYRALCPGDIAAAGRGADSARSRGPGVPGIFSGDTHWWIPGQQSGTGISALGGVRRGGGPL